MYEPLCQTWMLYYSIIRSQIATWYAMYLSLVKLMKIEISWGVARQWSTNCLISESLKVLHVIEYFLVIDVCLCIRQYRLIGGTSKIG